MNSTIETYLTIDAPGKTFLNNLKKAGVNTFNSYPEDIIWINEVDIRIVYNKLPEDQFEIIKCFFLSINFDTHLGTRNLKLEDSFFINYLITYFERKHSLNFDKILLERLFELFY